MHREFQKYIGKAEGETPLAIVAFCDIRGFSEFSKRLGESKDLALYMRRVYQRLMRDYFPRAHFWKPTGDGMLVVYHCETATASTTAREVIDAARRTVREFARICQGDASVHFDVPKDIGFGIAFGIVCRLHAEGRTLDYSGRVLNLAARLQALAHPRGIILDGEFSETLIPVEWRGEFTADRVHLKGITDREPRPVRVQSGVLIPDSARLPVGPARRTSNRASYTPAELLDLAPEAQLTLSETPWSTTDMVVEVHAPAVRTVSSLEEILKPDDLLSLLGPRGEPIAGQTRYVRLLETEWRYVGPPSTPRVEFKIGPLATKLRLVDLNSADRCVHLEVQYWSAKSDIPESSG